MDRKEGIWNRYFYHHHQNYAGMYNSNHVTLTLTVQQIKRESRDCHMTSTCRSSTGTRLFRRWWVIWTGNRQSPVSSNRGFWTLCHSVCPLLQTALSVSQYTCLFPILSLLISCTTVERKCTVFELLPKYKASVTHPLSVSVMCTQQLLPLHDHAFENENATSVPLCTFVYTLVKHYPPSLSFSSHVRSVGIGCVSNSRPSPQDLH